MEETGVKTDTHGLDSFRHARAQTMASFDSMI